MKRKIKFWVFGQPNFHGLGDSLIFGNPSFCLENKGGEEIFRIITNAAQRKSLS